MTVLANLGLNSAKAKATTYFANFGKSLSDLEIDLSNLVHILQSGAPFETTDALR